MKQLSIPGGPAGHALIQSFGIELGAAAEPVVAQIKRQVLSFRMLDPEIIQQFQICWIDGIENRNGGLLKKGSLVRENLAVREADGFFAQNKFSDIRMGQIDGAADVGSLRRNVQVLEQNLEGFPAAAELNRLCE